MWFLYEELITEQLVSMIYPLVTSGARMFAASETVLKYQQKD